MALMGGICGEKHEALNAELVLGPTGGLDVGRRSREGQERAEKSKTPFASVRHRPVIIADSRSLREKHVWILLRKTSQSLSIGSRPAGTRGKAGKVSETLKTSTSPVRQARCFCSRWRTQTDFFEREKGWRGPTPHHVGACQHQFSPLGPTGTTRAGEREGMSSFLTFGN